MRVAEFFRHTRPETLWNDGKLLSQVNQYLMELGNSNYEEYVQVATQLKAAERDFYYWSMTTETEPRFLTADQVEFLDLTHHLGMQKKIFRGMTWHQAVGEVNLTRRNYHQSTHAGVATLMMEWLRSQLPQDVYVADTNTGPGALSFAALEAGFQVIVCVDKDPEVLSAAETMTKKHFQQSRARFYHADARNIAYGLSFEGNEVLDSSHPKLAIVDPSWVNGVSSTDPSIVDFGIFGALGPMLPQLYLTKGGFDYLALKVPASMSEAEIKSHAQWKEGSKVIEAGCQIFVIRKRWIADLFGAAEGNYESNEIIVLYTHPRIA